MKSGLEHKSLPLLTARPTDWANGPLDTSVRQINSFYAISVRRWLTLAISDVIIVRHFLITLGLLRYIGLKQIFYNFKSAIKLKFNPESETNHGQFRSCDDQHDAAEGHQTHAGVRTRIFL